MIAREIELFEDLRRVLKSASDVMQTSSWNEGIGPSVIFTKDKHSVWPNSSMS
jgi:hypothetical protein